MSAFLLRGRLIQMERPRAALSTTAARVRSLADAVVGADPAAIEAAARRLGRSRRYLAPVAWAAGALVLMVRGIELLVLNWRLTLVEILPAFWVWLIMYDLKQHALRGAVFREVGWAAALALVLLCVVATIAAFWCNTVFGFAIAAERPLIGPAWQQTTACWRQIVATGAVLGGVLAFAAIAVPRLESRWTYLAASSAVYALMLVSLVAVPARILGVAKRRATPRETFGRWAAGGALSAVAMTPGFVLDRIGVTLLGIDGLRPFGFVFLTIGVALYAAGLSSVRAVKLSMKLDTPASTPNAG